MLLFKDFPFFSSGSYFIEGSGTICAISIEGIIGFIHVFRTKCHLKEKLTHNGCQTE